MLLPPIKTPAELLSHGFWQRDAEVMNIEMLCRNYECLESFENSGDAETLHFRWILPLITQLGVPVVRFIFLVQVLQAADESVRAW